MEYIVKNINEYNSNEINNFYKMIYKSKKNRLKFYKNHLKFRQSIIGEILLSKLLKQYYNINYTNLTFNTNKFGKSFIVNSNIYYNISHSFDYVTTIISNNPVGIDIEKIRNTNLNVIEKFATNKEKEYILSSTQNIEKRIFEIYTLKEAYFKMLGTNLYNIKDIEFSIINHKIICSNKNTICNIDYSINGYIISICEKINSI